MRLQATGELDTLFGDNGRTWIDLPTKEASGPVFRDIAVRADGSVIAAGGDYWTDRGFVVRLLGDAGGASAGVVSFTGDDQSPQESDGQAVVHVRRSGGSGGDISVRYRTVANENATSGEDYTRRSGILHWADGETSGREIAVKIAADDGPAESYEGFSIVLDEPEGGAGLGTSVARVTIQPDGAPSGQIAIPSGQDELVGESGFAEVWVARNYYYEGEVSVAVSVEGITATAGDDFIANPVTLTWGPDDRDWKPVQIQIVADDAQEDAETFRVVLSSPTGGAILGPNTEHIVEIVANDAPPPPEDRSRGGGGAAGFLSLLLLGLAEAIRAARRRIRELAGGAA
jgi:Calx-beta domain-containing protein